jgi:hypothetical protein
MLGNEEKSFLKKSQRWEIKKNRFWRFPNVGKRRKTVFGDFPTLGKEKKSFLKISTIAERLKKIRTL